jgi:hypothetical protein
MDPLRTALAEAIRSSYPERADVVGQDMTHVDLYPTPFFHAAQIAFVLRRVPSPIAFYAGWIPGRMGDILTYRPESFVELARADGVSITTPENAIAYARVYLDTTRNMSALFYLVDSIADCKLLKPTPERAERLQSFQDRFGKVIVPPTAKPVGNGYAVTQFAVRNQSLLSLRVEVSTRGELRAETTVLANDLPLVYGG